MSHPWMIGTCWEVSELVIVLTESFVISAVMLSVDGDVAIVPSVIGIVMALQFPCTASGIAIGDLVFLVVFVRSTTASWNWYSSRVLDNP